MESSVSYIWQRSDWPSWRYDPQALGRPLAEVSREQGVLLGRMRDLGFELRGEASLSALTEDVLRTSEIEGETFRPASVRSSVARQLGLDIGALAPVDRRAEGVVSMILDATENHAAPLTEARLWGWHAALFPTGYSNLSKVRVGAWRDDQTSGPMQVVSGRISRQRVHFEAPPSSRLHTELTRFFAWANAETQEPSLLKAGLAHLWFVTLHPFDDGNGRIARAIGDLFLSRADDSPQRFYSLSAQIQRERRDYYEVLEQTQRGTLDVTPWLQWFLAALKRALESAQEALNEVLFKAHFWARWRSVPLHPRQVKVLNRLLDGFEGKLTNRKWAALAKCSPDTALRDLTHLVELGILKRAPGGGRSASYLWREASSDP